MISSSWMSLKTSSNLTFRFLKICLKWFPNPKTKLWSHWSNAERCIRSMLKKQEISSWRWSKKASFKECQRTLKSSLRVKLTKLLRRCWYSLTKSASSFFENVKRDSYLFSPYMKLETFSTQTTLTRKQKSIGTIASIPSFNSFMSWITTERSLRRTRI